MIQQGQAKYPVQEVMLHCAAIKTGQFYGMEPIQIWAEINRWHFARGFKKGFGYHGLFMPDGYHMGGRPLEMIGAGCIEKNRGVIHLLMIESREIKPPAGYRLEDCRFEQWFKPEQGAAVRSYINALPDIRLVSGHNDYARKLCPGFKVKSGEWLKERNVP